MGTSEVRDHIQKLREQADNFTPTDDPKTDMKTLARMLSETLDLLDYAENTAERSAEQSKPDPLVSAKLRQAVRRMNL